MNRLEYSRKEFGGSTKKGENHKTAMMEAGKVGFISQ